MSPQERFDEYLQSRGMRNTEQRRALVDLVFERHEHFDAEELMAQVPPRGKTGHVSRPTVYRTLNELVDAGLLRKFELDGRSVFEHDYGYPEHDHLYCKRCRKLIEFHSEELLRLLGAVAEEHGFQVEGHRLMVHGVCPDCKVRRRTKRKQDLV